MIAWIGVGFSLISSILFSCAAICLRREREKEEAVNMQYLMPGNVLGHEPSSLQIYFSSLLLMAKWRLLQLTTMQRQPFSLSDESKKKEPIVRTCHDRLHPVSFILPCSFPSSLSLLISYHIVTFGSKPKEKRQYRLE